MIHKVIVPKTRLVNLAIAVPEDFIGEEMEVIAFLKKDGLQEFESAGMVSPALPGSPLTNHQFVNWIKQAELMPTISLEDAKSQWTNQREKLLQLIK